MAELRIRSKERPTAVIDNPLSARLEETVKTTREASERVQQNLGALSSLNVTRGMEIRRVGEDIRTARQNIQRSQSIPDTVLGILQLFNDDLNPAVQRSKIAEAQTDLTLLDQQYDSAAAVLSADIQAAQERSAQAGREFSRALQTRGAELRESEERRAQERQEFARTGEEREAKRFKQAQQLREIQIRQAKLSEQLTLIQNVPSDNELLDWSVNDEALRTSGYSRRMVNEEISRRVAANNAQQMSKLQLQNAQLQNRRETQAENTRAVSSIVNSMTFQQLSDGVSAIRAGNLNTIPDPNGSPRNLPAGLVEQQWLAQSKLITEQEVAQTKDSSRRIQMSSDIGALTARLTNAMSIFPSNPTSKARTEVFKSDLMTAQALVDNVNRPLTDEDTKFIENVNERFNAWEKQIIEGAPQKTRPAVKEFLATGSIGRLNATNTVGVAGVTPNAFPNNHPFANSMQRLGAKLNEIGAERQLRQGRQQVSPIQLLLAGDPLEASEMVIEAFREDPEIQAEYNSEILFQGIEQAVVDMARDIPQLNSLLTQNGRLNWKSYDSGEDPTAPDRSTKAFLQSLAEINEQLIRAGADPKTNLFKDMLQRMADPEFRQRFNNRVHLQFAGIFEQSFFSLVEPSRDAANALIRAMGPLQSEVMQMIEERRRIVEEGRGVGQIQTVGPSLNPFAGLPPQGPSPAETSLANQMLQALRRFLPESEATAVTRGTGVEP